MSIYGSEGLNFGLVVSQRMWSSDGFRAEPGSWGAQPRIGFVSQRIGSLGLSFGGVRFSALSNERSDGLRKREILARVLRAGGVQIDDQSKSDVGGQRPRFWDS